MKREGREEARKRGHKGRDDKEKIEVYCHFNDKKFFF